MLNIDVLHALKVSILSDNQRRLQDRFESFPFAASNGQAAIDYQAVYQQYWQRQNERDALDIKAIEALIESVSSHSSVHTDLAKLEAKWLRQSKMLMEDSTQQELLSQAVLERQKILDLRAALINHCAGGRSSIRELTEKALAEQPQYSIDH